MGGVKIRSPAEKVFESLTVCCRRYRKNVTLPHSSEKEAFLKDFTQRKFTFAGVSAVGGAATCTFQASGFGIAAPLTISLPFTSTYLSTSPSTATGGAAMPLQQACKLFITELPYPCLTFGHTISLLCHSCVFSCAEAVSFAALPLPSTVAFLPYLNCTLSFPPSAAFSQNFYGR